MHTFNYFCNKKNNIYHQPIREFHAQTYDITKVFIVDGEKPPKDIKNYKHVKRYRPGVRRVILGSRLSAWEWETNESASVPYYINSPRVVRNICRLFFCHRSQLSKELLIETTYSVSYYIIQCL